MRSCRAAVITWVLLAAGCTGSAGPGATSPVVPSPRAAVQTVQPGLLTTAAGAGFCRGDSRPDPASTTVGALSVDPQGRIYFDTGPVAEGLIGKVDEGGRANLLNSTVTGAGDPLETWKRKPALSSAGRLAADRRGGVYISAGTKVLHLDAAGVGLTTVAGDPTVRAEAIGGKSTGDGGPARKARFNSIQSLTTDERSNLVVADQIDRDRATFRVRYVNLGQDPVMFYRGTPWQTTVEPGTVDTIAGGGDRAQRDSPFREVRGLPPALAVAGPAMYLASFLPAGAGRRGSAGVWMANTGEAPLTAHGMTVEPGRIVAVAGAGPEGLPGEKETAKSANLGYIPGIAADSGGNLFIADENRHRIRRVDSAGTMTTLAGAGGALGPGSFNGNGIKAKKATLNRPYDVKVDGAGKVYISDRLNGQIRVVGSDGVIHAAAGAGLGRSPLCRQARRGRSERSGAVRVPVAAAAALEGDVVFAVSSVPGIKKLDHAGRTLSVGGAQSDADCGSKESCEPGEGASSPLHQLRAEELGSDGAGGLYVLDRGRPQLVYVNLGPRAQSVHGERIAPLGSRFLDVEPNRTDAGAISRQVLGSASSLAADRRGVFVAGAGTVLHKEVRGPWKVLLSSTRLIGECCSTARILALDGPGNLYIAEESPARIWLLNRQKRPIRAHGVSIAPGEIERIAGRAECSFAAGDRCFGFGGDDGPAREAQFRIPAGMAVDKDGSLYVSDRMEHVVRKIDRSGTITTVAGTGQAGFNGDGLSGRLGLLSSPSQLVLDACGDLLINDPGNLRIRRLKLSTGPCERR